MLRMIVLCAGLVPALACGVEPADKKHKMSYRVSGGEFVVSTTVRVDGGWYLVLTSVGNEDILPPILQYTIIQNSDEIPTTGGRDVTVEWRFPAREADYPPHWVRGRVVKLNSRELELIGAKARHVTPGEGAEPKKKQPEIKFRTDGDVTIAYITLQVQADRHLVLATFDNTEASAPGLQYTVIVNSDDLFAKKKDVTIEWRIPSDLHRPYRVHGQVVQLSTRELQVLGGKALDLVK